MKQFVRNASVKLKFNFEDADQNQINPPYGATLSISYIPLGGAPPTTVSYPLVNTAGTYDWVYTWDSSVSEPCIVYAHAETEGGLPISAIDCEFRLKANRSNKQLAGDY